MCVRGWVLAPTKPQTQAEMGVLVEVQLRNFMNHANTGVTFEPHVNFITGVNGGTEADQCGEDGGDSAPIGALPRGGAGGGGSR